MAVKYGGTMQIQPIPITEFGFPQPKPKVEHQWWEGWLTAFRVILTVAEIGLAFVPGVGALADIGIGLAFGAVNQVLDVATGSANVVGSLLNFGAPVIGGVFTGLNNVRQVAKITTKVEEGLLSGAGMLASMTEMAVAHEAAALTKFQAFNSGLKGVEKELLNSTKIAYIQMGEAFPRTIAKDVRSAVKDATNYLMNKTLDVGFKGADNISREIFEDARMQSVIRAMTTNPEEYEVLMGLLRSVSDVDELRQVLFAYANSLDAIQGKRFLRVFKDRVDDVAKSIVSISSEHVDAMVEFNKVISNALEGVIQSIEKDESVWAKINKFFSSQKGYKFVQGVQLIDPNDLGRAPIEALYKMLRKRISKAFKKIGQFAKADQRVRDAFAKNGGVPVDSQWHIGYRVIKAMGTTNLVQITYTKNAKTGALRHVLVMATDRQLKLYEQSPGRMYRNTWALSTGQKIDLESMLGIISGMGKGDVRKMASVLGFIPIPALRNILSLVSNIVENVSTMVKGDYGTKWWPSVFRSFRNTGISRSFRLATFALGDGLSKRYGKKIFKHIGREIQRFNTNITAKGIKNVADGKKFLSNNLGSQFLHMTAIGARSHSLRTLRRRGGSSIPHMLSARRKLETVKRIPNTLVPGRPFKGIRW